MENLETLNEIETIILALRPGESVHLGHSSVIGNFGGFRVGLDLTTVDGWIQSPFSNLMLGNSARLNHLIPLVDVSQKIARPRIAKCLDILLYSHLHSDHFSLNFIAQAKLVNPKIRIICPDYTKEYLLHLEKSINNKEYFLNRIALRFYKDILDNLKSESNDQRKYRKELIEQIEELSPKSNLVIKNKQGSITITSLKAIHPPFQLYVRTPYESKVAPPVSYYKLAFQDNKQESCAFLIGETAVDLELISEIFKNRNTLKIVFLPITEQSNPKGIKNLEGYFAHESLLAMTLIERIVMPGTKLVLLHQGLWYFELMPRDILNARLTFEKMPSSNTFLPFVGISKQILSFDFSDKKSNLLEIIRTIPIRRKQFNGLAKYARKLPISGEIDGLPVGSVIRFGVLSQEKEIHSLDAIKLTLDTHLVEYQGLHAEVDSGWEIQKTLLQYTLFVIGTAITLVSAFPNKEVLFLVASIMLSLLGWGYLEQSIRMMTVGRYYKKILNPRIRQLILEINRIKSHSLDAKKFEVMGWEDFFRGGNFRTALMGIAAFGKFAYAFMPGIAFSAAFYLSKYLSNVPWSSMEKIAFIFTSGLSLLPLITLLFNVRFAFTGED